MNEYGLKIKNIQASSIYECNLGVRDNLDTKDAMLTNSLFLDFLMENGIRIWKDGSTRDVVCLEFGYGSRSYEDEIKHLEKLLKECDPNDEQRMKRITDLMIEARKNESKYDKKSKSELRTLFYVNGVPITYKTHNKDGTVIKEETIHYRMLYRTPGKAKKGTVYFICDRLYKKAREFLYMGIKLPKQNAPIVEIGAYSSLITSTIVGRVKIEPENILILKDFDSFFETNVVSIETNEKRECIAVRRDNYQVKNTMFDGQALIDSSIFPPWADGYILLRQHMFKAAAFCTHIQKYFRDHYGDGYEDAVIKDMWGNEHRAKDIKMITTDNACKWLKFDISFEYWSDWVHKNDSLFGIVKTAHPSKLGDVQKMSYQMVNTLDMDSMPEVIAETDSYLQKLQTDDDEFLRYLEKNQNFSNDFEVLIALVKQNRKFLRSDYFRERKKKIINAYVINMKTGKLIQNADNLVIVGSPYAMLMHAVGLNPEDDPTFEQEDEAIQCYTGRFGDGEYLAGFRSPQNSMNNIISLHNVYHQNFIQYFSFGQQIIAINLKHTDLQDRANGSDQDSDSLYVTNQKDIVAHAQRCRRLYPTIVNNIPKDKNQYSNTLQNFALIDNKLAKAQLAIGESSNLCQVSLTYSYSLDDPLFDDYVCILSVLAQAAIDNAKRTTLCDIPSEIRRIKRAMDINTNLYPDFWKLIKPEFNPYRTTKSGTQYMINRDLKCPMSYLYKYTPPVNRSEESTIPIQDFFNHYELTGNRKKSRKVEELIQKYSFNLYKYNVDDDGESEDYLLLRQDFDELIQDIRGTYISNNYLPLMSWLINRAFMITPGISRNQHELKTTLNKNRSLLLKVLYDVSPRQFLQVFAKNS